MKTAPNGKMPKQMNRETVNTTPLKGVHDDMLGAIFRVHSIDSMSSIKDESMDIDLTACIPINPPPQNGNSSSSNDFWRQMFEENTQNVDQLLSLSRDDISNDISFLKPDPPSVMPSPLKKTPVKAITTPNKLNAYNIKISPVCPSTLVQVKVFKEELPDVQQDNAIFSIPNEFSSQDKIKSDENSEESVFRVFSEQHPSTALDEAAASVSLSPTMNLTTATTFDMNVEPTYMCKNCGAQCLEKGEEQAHKNLGHDVKAFFRCPECNRDFEVLTSLKKHARAHRPDNRKEVWKKCPDCGKSLKLGSMWMHRKIHSDNKKYSCDICGQKFIQKINLTNHARTHSSDKPFECPECQKRFQERSHLQRHQKYHAQTRSFRCEKCGKLYKTERCLKVHNLVHLEQRPFACSMCEKSFISNSKLKQHTNIHTGLRPFKCKYCPRDFTNFPNWLKHTRRRHKVDHKTGERLENIPSYCSTKSSKTLKTKKNELIEENSASHKIPNSIASGNVAVKQTEKLSKLVNIANGSKCIRKKKQAEQGVLIQTLPVNNYQQKLSIIQQQSHQLQKCSKFTAATGENVTTTRYYEQIQKQIQQASSGNPVLKQKMCATTSKNSTTVSGNGLNKTNGSTGKRRIKHERKQLIPKQLQQQSETGKNKFLDTYGLSLASADNQFMDEYLALEEAGLYDSPICDIGNDNAISADVFHVKKEGESDYVCNTGKDLHMLPLKKTEINRLACPSLESSPFSSPASMELVAPTAVATGTNYYMPKYAISTQTTSMNNCELLASLQNIATSTSTGITNVCVNVPGFVPQCTVLPSVNTFFVTAGTMYAAGSIGSGCVETINHTTNQRT